MSKYKVGHYYIFIGEHLIRPRLFMPLSIKIASIHYRGIETKGKINEQSFFCKNSPMDLKSVEITKEAMELLLMVYY